MDLAMYPNDKVILIAQENARPENSFFEDPTSPSTQRNKKRNTALFFVIAVFFNVLYVASVFDTYFLTSLSTNIAPIPQTAQAPADRVVIFLADGTKADAFFSLHSDGTPVTPFFRHIMETKGSYGVSFTQVPTESRTCSVAIMGGFYEDPSAITKGWSENPVNYDHFLNETTWGWGYGTPNIISLFYSNGKNKQTVNTSGFPESMLDFGATPSELDDWAINALSEVLDTMAPQNETLNEMLRTPKVGIFVHLIGGDTAAHGHKPYSSVYYDTISHYDQLINNTVAKIDAFYNDSKTAYIFTSDHGLTNSGTHGDGAPNNTKTPFVAWGAGISGPIREKVKGESHDELSRPWGLEGLTRRDIHQVDISPLLSSLVGVPVPVNNMGMLPLEYLDVDQKSKSEFLLTNARQVCAIYQKKDQDKRKDEPFFISYKVSVDDVNSAISSIGSSIQSGKYEESQAQSRELIQDCRDGINYLQRYDWLLLFSIVILGYIGYSMYGMTTTLRKFSDNYSDELYSNYKRLTIGKILYLVFSVCLLTFFVLKKAPLQYYGYALFPLYFWFDLIFNGRHVFRSITITKAQIGYSLFFITCLGLLVWCQFERRILSLTYVVIAVWQVLARRDISQKMLILWVTSCIVMAIFPLMPPIGSRDVYLYTLGWLLTVAIIIFGTVYWKEKMSWPSIISKACVLLSFYIANDSDRLLFSGGVSMFNKTIAWGILVMTIVFPMIFELNSNRHFMLRLISVFTCLSSLMIILSTSYELLFFACFAIQLAIWVQMEKVSVQDSRHSLGLHHLKNSFFILFFANIAFFGMGNLASINFNLESVFRFVTVFSPFIMTGLLIVRIMLPFVLLAIATTTVSKHSMRLPSSSMLIIPMLSFGAGVTMSMFLLVKNTGSWLEMGNSLARFIIASLFILIILALTGLGYLLMRNSKDEFELQGYEFSVKKGDPTDISDTDLKSVNI